MRSTNTSACQNRKQSAAGPQPCKNTYRTLVQIWLQLEGVPTVLTYEQNNVVRRFTDLKLERD